MAKSDQMAFEVYNVETRFFEFIKNGRKEVVEIFNWFKIFDQKTIR